MWRYSNTKEIVTYRSVLALQAEEANAKEGWFLPRNKSSRSWVLWGVLGLSTRGSVTLRLFQWNKFLIHSAPVQGRQECLRKLMLPPVPKDADVSLNLITASRYANLISFIPSSCPHSLIVKILWQTACSHHTPWCPGYNINVPGWHGAILTAHVPTASSYVREALEQLRRLVLHYLYFDTSTQRRCTTKN